MSIERIAADCPAPVVIKEAVSIRRARDGSGLARVSESVTPGDTNWASKLRALALRLDMAARFGGGGVGIAIGLTIAPGKGLQAALSPGLAMIDGLVDVEAERAVPIVPETKDAFIWLLQNGTVVVVNRETKQPQAACCYLGVVTATEDRIVDVDTSGVMRLVGGHLFRETADEGRPGDTPPEGVAFYTVTRGGLYLWDGSRYWNLAQAEED